MLTCLAFFSWKSLRKINLIQTLCLNLRGHVQHFSSTRSKKMLQHFFSENVTCGAYLQHAAILDFCSKRMLQRFCSKINSVWYCCNSLATFLMFCNTIFLSAAYFISRCPYVQHIFPANTTVILSWTYVYDFINNNGFSRRKHEIGWC